MAPLTRPGPPPRPLVEAVIRALALPRVGPVTLSEWLAEGRDARASTEAIVARTLPRLAPRERDRVEGWTARVLETVDRTPLHVLMPGYAGYPASLSDLEARPPILFARGRLELLDTPMVALVGTRRCSEEGLATATRIARDLARAGVTVVSGLARGIDAAAHRAAGPDRTIAVLGCGVDVSYPPGNAPLQRAIGAEGLLLSERLPGSAPLPYFFPERNRIIAGLARAVVVVEAPDSSGALITCRQAIALKRTVFAVPGALDSWRHAGSNLLIRDGGARLVTGAGEVLLKLGIPAPETPGGDSPPPELTGVGLALWRALDGGPVHVEQLATRVGLDPQRSLASLLALEVQGHARQLPGLRFVRA